jgi:hypothetical protein
LEKARILLLDETNPGFLYRLALFKGRCAPAKPKKIEEIRKESSGFREKTMHFREIYLTGAQDKRKFNISAVQMRPPPPTWPNLPGTATTDTF